MATDVAEATRKYLRAASGVTALIGQRFYTDQLPQKATMPACVISKLFTTHEHQLSDFGGLAHARLQCESYADTRAGADALAEAIRASGIVVHKGTTNGVDVRGVRVESGMSYRTDPATDGSDAQRYVSVLDLIVDYTET